MAKPVGARCNLDCAYCYYTEKTALAHGVHEMSDETLTRFVREYIALQPATAPVQFTWHGGEPLLRGMDFYRKAISLQQEYAEGRTIENCMQTNGTLLTPAWCQFLHEQHFLVGLTMDGPKWIHNR